MEQNKGELNNHEYIITYDVEPALDALNLTRDNVNPGILKKAIALSCANMEG